MKQPSSPAWQPSLASGNTLTSRLSHLDLSTISLLVSYLVMCLAFAGLTPYFLTVDNFVNIGQTLAVVGIIAVGQTMVLISGGVDLSVGSVAALAGVTASLFWNNEVLPIGWCIAAGLLSGTLIGLANGLIITKLKINPLITTLGMFSIIRGLAFILSGGQTNQFQNEFAQFLGRGNVGGIPFSLILMIILYVVFTFILGQTTFGRNLYALGGSAIASRLASLTVDRYLLVVYTFCGFLSAVGGILIASQLASGTPQAAVGLEFTVIAAVVLGGTSLTGGKGTLLGTFIGVLILRTLDNGLILLHISSYWQQVGRGVILLLAVSLDQLRLRLGQR